MARSLVSIFGQWMRAYLTSELTRLFSAPTNRIYLDLKFIARNGKWMVLPVLVARASKILLRTQLYPLLSNKCSVTAYKCHQADRITFLYYDFNVI